MSLTGPSQGGLTYRSRLLLGSLSLVAALGLAIPNAVAQDAPPPPSPDVAEPDAAAEVEPPEPVFAVVDGYEITERDLGRMVELLGAGFAQVPENQRLEVLVQAAIEFRLMVAAGEALAVDQTEEFQNRMRDLRDNELRLAFVDNFIRGRISEDAIRAEYDAWVAQLDLPVEVQIQAIRVGTEAEAGEVLRRLADGEEFAAIALEVSLDRATAENGGIVRETVDDAPKDYWAPGELFQEFDDVVFDIPAGTIHPVPILRGDFWHIIGVTDRRQQPPPTYEEMRDTFRDQLFRAEYNSVLAGLSDQADIEVFISGEPAPVEEAPADPAAVPAEPAAPAGGD